MARQNGRGGAQQGGSSGEGDAGDEEGVTTAEYNKWLTLESNWGMAEDTRQSNMEGSQFRKARDERHRERGMERQAASIEQMKQAKGRVEEHRQSNLEQGKDVREDVASWKVAMYEQQEAWVDHGKQLKEKITTQERQRAERDALTAYKKKFSADVRKEVQQLSSEADAQKEKVLASNRAQADKIKKETGDEVTDAAKKMFFEQRRAAALATTSLLKGLETERKDIRNKFREDSHRNREKVRIAAPAVPHSFRPTLAASLPTALSQLPAP